MLIPGLPNDKISKVIFFGGVLIVVSSLLLMDSYYHVASDLEDKFKTKLHEVKYQVELDSTIIEYANWKIKHRDIDSISLQETIFQLKKDSITLIKNNEELITLQVEHEYLRSRFFLDDDFLLFLFYIGIVFILVGLVLWIKHESQEEASENWKFNKAQKKIPCQSCGMQLHLDFNPHMEQEYCSTCFNGTEYTEPELTFSEMSKKIETRMKIQDINQRKIKQHLKGLRALNRWSEKLRWK